MKKHFILFLIFIIFIVSSVSLLLILNFIDPYQYKLFAIIALFICLFVFILSFFGLLIYFFKKVYNRGTVSIIHVISSLRQGFFIAIFGIGLFIMYLLQITLLYTGLLLFIIILLMELLIQNIN